VVVEKKFNFSFWSTRMFHLQTLQLVASTPTSGNGETKSRRGRSSFPDNLTGNSQIAPSLNIPLSVPILNPLHLDFEQLCSIAPASQYPFIIPPMIPIESPGIGNGINQKLPSIWRIEKCDPVPEAYREIHAPTLDHLKIEKQAARLVRIRRSKMNKHQYKKLKKRMGRTWAKYRQRRKMRRLKVFYTTQSSIIEKAKAFDPEVYVRTYIQAAKSFQGTTKASVGKLEKEK
jgi:hypothetical protein